MSKEVEIAEDKKISYEFESLFTDMFIVATTEFICDEMQVHKKLNQFAIESFLSLIYMKLIPGDPSNMFLATSFTRKMSESSDSMHSSIFMLENVRYHRVTRSGRSLQENMNFDFNQFGSPKTHNWNKIQHFL